MHGHYEKHRWYGLYIALGFLLVSFILVRSNPVVKPIPTRATGTAITNKSAFITAIQTAQPGDTLVLQGEITGGIITVLRGTQSAPITITGGTIRGGNNARMFELRDSQYVVFDNVVFDGAGSDSVLYILNSQNILIKNSVIRNGGGECVRLKAGSQHNSFIGNTIESCGRTKWNPPSGKNGEGIYVGTAPEQLAKNVEEAAKSTATDKSGYFANPDNTSLNLIQDNIIRPGYPENTKGNECVDIKEGARHNLIKNNMCSGQLDANSGGMESRGEENIFYKNVIDSIICGAGIRLGGDDKQTQGVGNWIVENVFNDYNSTQQICAQSTTSAWPANHGAVKVEAPNQGTMCGNTAKNTNIASGTFANQINTAVFLNPCQSGVIENYLSQYVFGVIGIFVPTPTATTIVNSPTPTSTPAAPTATPSATVTAFPSPTTTVSPTVQPCPNKSIGDANCDGSVSLVDFEIWRKEYLGTLISVNADFDTSGVVNLADFQIWRNGYFL